MIDVEALVARCHEFDSRVAELRAFTREVKSVLDEFTAAAKELHEKAARFLMHARKSN